MMHEWINKFTNIWKKKCWKAPPLIQSLLNMVFKTDGCTPNPCKFHGTCRTYDNGVFFACFCQVGYSGQYCQIEPSTSKILFRKLMLINRFFAIPSHTYNIGLDLLIFDIKMLNFYSNYCVSCFKTRKPRKNYTNQTRGVRIVTGKRNGWWWWLRSLNHKNYHYFKKRNFFFFSKNKGLLSIYQSRIQPPKLNRSLVFFPRFTFVSFFGKILFFFVIKKVRFS